MGRATVLFDAKPSRVALRRHTAGSCCTAVSYCTHRRGLGAMSSSMGNAEVPRESGKSMCACMSCKLVKTYGQVSFECSLILQLLCCTQASLPEPLSIQFVDRGCENCEWLHMEGDGTRVTDCTTVNFTGYDSFVMELC